jgi:GNAT superfamily N-acetyltransferase
MAGVSVQRVDPANPQHIDNFRSMTREYLLWLGEDLGFQGIEKELASLPGSYHPSQGGAMLLAHTAAADDNSTSVCIGAVALRPLTGNTLDDLTAVGGVPIPRLCEMKRLFVLPSHHGRGAGTILTQAIVQEAKAMGYVGMVLDTLGRLEGANRVYAAQGFAACERYNDCPLPGVLYFMRKLE